MNSYSIIQVFCVVILLFLGMRLFRYLRKSDATSKKITKRRGRKRRVNAPVASRAKTKTVMVEAGEKNDNDLSTVRFDELGIDPRLLKGVVDAGFEFCTRYRGQGACTAPTLPDSFCWGARNDVA